MSQQWNPLQDLVVLQDRMNRLFEDATQRRNRADANAGDEFERADWTPAADIYETESGYLIAMDLPGIDRQALEIDVDENRLVVKGTRAIEEPVQHRVERPRGPLQHQRRRPGSRPLQIGHRVHRAVRAHRWRDCGVYRGDQGGQAAGLRDSREPNAESYFDFKCSM